MIRTPILAAALLIPLLAGCISSDPIFNPASPAAYNFDGTYTWVNPIALDATGNLTKTHPLLGDEAFPLGVQQIVPGSGAEPSVGVTSSGAIFVIVWDVLWRTRDNGHTWDSVYEFTSPEAPVVQDQWSSSDPMLWVDPATDRIFVLQMFPGTTCLYLATSDDEGATWSDDTLAVAPGFGSCLLPYDDHPKIVTAPQGPNGRIPPVGYENVVVICTNKVAQGLAVLGSWCATSYNGGATFAHEVPAVLPQDGCSGINGSPAVHPDGTIVLPVGNIGGIAGVCPRPVMVAVSRDSGLTWTERRMPGTERPSSIDPDIVFTPDGTGYMVYTGQDTLTYLVRTPDAFQTWEGPWLLSPPDHTMNVFGAITAGDDGRIAVAFLGTSSHQEPLGRPTDASDAVSGTTWHLYIASSIDASGANPSFVVQQVTPQEDPVQIGCIWLRGGGGGPLGCRNLLDFIDVTRDPDGRFVVAFTDGCVPRNGCTADPQNANFQSRDTTVSLALQDRGASLFEAKGNLLSLGLKAPPLPSPEAHAAPGASR